MIKFVIDKIHLRNVRSYGDEGMDMDFPLDNLTVFTGHVGAGKSTILKAVSMALYGEDGGVKGEKLTIDDMVNERSGKNLEIDLYFRAIDTITNQTDNYEIHLYHKHSKFSNKLVLIKNGTDISANGKIDTYRLIEKITIPKEVYHNIYYFTQQAKNFFTALPNGEQKEIFNSILDLSEYETYYNNAREHLSEIETKIDVKNGDIHNQENNLQTLKTLKSNSERDLIQFKLDNEEKLKILKSQIDEYKESLKNVESVNQDDIDSINDTINNLKHKKSLSEIEYQNELKLKDKSISDLTTIFTNNTVPSLKDKYIKLKLEQSKDIDDNISELNLQIQKSKQEIETIKSNNNIKYLEEEKNLKNQYDIERKEFNDKIIELNNVIHKSNEERLEKLTKLKSDNQKEVDELKSTKTKYESKISVLETNILHNKNTIESNRSKIEKYQEDLNKPDAICSLCGQKLASKSHVEKHIENIQSEIDKIETEIDRDNKIIEDCKTTINTVINTKINDIVNNFNIDKEKIESDYKKITSECNIKIEENNSKLNTLLIGYNSNIDECKKKYVYDSDNEHERNIIDCNSKLNDLNNKKNDLVENLRNQYKVEFQKLNDDLQSKINNINNDFEIKKRKYEEDITKFENEMNNSETIKNDLLKNKQYLESIENQIKDAETEYKNLKNNNSACKDREKQINDFDNVINDSNVSLIKLKKEYDELCDEKQILEFWKTAFSDSGIKSMLIDSAIPHMNQCVREELDRVCPGVFTVSFDTLSETKSGNIRDKFSINIVHNVKCATGHKKLSGGEKRIIDFCCMSALRSLAEKLYGKMFSHIFYDEVLDSLDSESRELFCRSMKYQSNDHRNITLVTHALTEDVDPDRIFPF